MYKIINYDEKTSFTLNTPEEVIDYLYNKDIDFREYSSHGRYNHGKMNVKREIEGLKGYEHYGHIKVVLYSEILHEYIYHLENDIYELEKCHTIDESQLEFLKSSLTKYKRELNLL